jgi:hypothetical protein
MMTSSDFELEKGQNSDELSHDSQALGTENEERPAKDPNLVEIPNESESEYPHGIRLAIIVVSLMLSTFLVALDNVSPCFLSR